MVPGESPALREGIRLFNRGEFFACHEVWEEEWRSARPPARLFLQALIHLAVAFHHRQQGNPAGQERQLGKGLKKLAGYLPEYAGIDTGALYHACVRFRSGRAGAAGTGASAGTPVEHAPAPGHDWPAGAGEPAAIDAGFAAEASAHVDGGPGVGAANPPSPGAGESGAGNDDSGQAAVAPGTGAGAGAPGGGHPQPARSGACAATNPRLAAGTWTRAEDDPRTSAASPASPGAEGSGGGNTGAGRKATAAPKADGPEDGARITASAGIARGETQSGGASAPAGAGSAFLQGSNDGGAAAAGADASAGDAAAGFPRITLRR